MTVHGGPGALSFQPVTCTSPLIIHFICSCSGRACFTECMSGQRNMVPEIEMTVVVMTTVMTQAVAQLLPVFP